MGWTTGVRFPSGKVMTFFLFSTASRPALGSTQPHIQRVPGVLSPALKRSGREADHSPPFSADVKNVWSNTSTLPVRLHGVVLSYAVDTSSRQLT
jgi:hypothetical protein